MTVRREPGRVRLPPVLVLGGGRWARVIAGVLLDLVTPDTPLLLASRSGRASIRHWIDEKGLADRIAIVDHEDLALPPGAAVIVANAASSHVESALWALERGASVLVEKPLALSRADALRLRDHADRLGALLAPALVFRFASYLDRFATLLGSLGSVEHVEIIWTDPAAELRHGETKRYDASVSVIQDCLPHAMSLLAAIGGAEPRLQSVLPERGGASVAIAMVADDRNYDIVLQRNGSSRRRVFRAKGKWGVAELDFAIEPGEIRVDGVLQPATMQAHDSRPLGAMLGAFLRAAAGAPPDRRLDIGPAILAAMLTEQAMLVYDEKLADQIALGLPRDDEIYALTEVLQRDGRLEDDALTAAIVALRQRLADGAPLQAAVNATRRAMARH